MIEPRLHQIWHPLDSERLPREWERFASTWRSHHPGYGYVLWGPEESRRFVAEHHPDFLAVYDAYPSRFQRIDALRVLLLEHFGGVCVDLDLECLRDVGPLLERRTLVFATEPPRSSLQWREKGFAHLLSTSFVASERGHPFWTRMKDALRRSAGRPELLESTGAFALTRCFEAEPEPLSSTLLAPDVFAPIEEPEIRDGSALDVARWVERTRHAHGVHHWARSWDPAVRPAPALRPYHGGVPAKIRHPQLHQERDGQLLGDGPLVSCLMVSRGWREPARWAIECFQAQTYTNRELVIATTNAEGNLRSWLAELNDPRIRFAGVFAEGTSLGALRNLSVDHARGELVCTWDDDDLYGADRLAGQVTALLTTGAEAAFLERISVWWPARRELAWTCFRPWENSMLARRRSLPRYREVDRGEDTEVLASLVRAHPIVLVDDPNLYVYTMNGGNTWSGAHFDRFLDHATFEAEGEDYERALSVVARHVPVLPYLAWLQQRDPRTFAPLDPPAPPGASPPAAAAPAPRPAPPRASGPPLRFLFAWELGGGLGHAVPLAQLAHPLLEAGHEVHLALCDLSTARAALGALAAHPRLRLWQAPTWSVPLVGHPPPASLGEVLFRAGYLDARRLLGVVEGWESLLRSVGPDLLLADAAPTAMLAARGHRLPVATAGTGFFHPLPRTPIPAFRDWEPIPRARLEQAEELVLATCNAILAARNQPPLAALHELFTADEHFLLTVPELDHFPERGCDPARYWGILPAATQGQPPAWPRGTEPAVFAYVKSEYAPATKVLQALRAGPWRALAFVPGQATAVSRGLSTEKLAIVGDPLDMNEVVRTADAVLCHGGSGTVMTALSAGRPLVILPMHVEQYLVGRRVQELGAGLVATEDRSDGVAGLLRRVVERPSFREAAVAFARRYAGVRGDRVADAVAARCEDLAREGRCSRPAPPAA